MTTYEYDAQGRVLRTVQASPWTAEDRALMLAWDMHQQSLCPGCSEPKETAWHWDNDGWFDVVDPITCHVCTVRRRHGAEDPDTVPAVEYLPVVYTRNHDDRPLPGSWLQRPATDTTAAPPPGS